MSQNPDYTRKSLVLRSKAYVQTTDWEDLLYSIQKLEKGQLFKVGIPDSAEIWAKAVKLLPDDITKFSPNSALDTLPHNVNLFQWKKKNGSNCTLCGESQTLIHVLNACSVARNK